MTLSIKVVLEKLREEGLEVTAQNIKLTKACNAADSFIC